MEYLKLNSFDNTYDVAFCVEQYAENDNLALEMVFKNDDDLNEPFTTLTVPTWIPTTILGRRYLLRSIILESPQAEPVVPAFVFTPNMNLT